MTETAWQARTRREKERAAYVAEHGNVCELCGNPPKSRGLSEDHDHKTGAHRGWLCFRCNRALPTYVDAEWLARAILYLDPDAWAEAVFVIAGVDDEWLKRRRADDGHSVTDAKRIAQDSLDMLREWKAVALGSASAAADEPARRKLGENDPGRYEIGVLIGPCTLAEATSLSERVSNATQGYLGAVVSLTTWREDDAAAADAPGETPCL